MKPPRNTFGFGELRATSITYHRNGSCGQGWWGIIFEGRIDGMKRRMLGTFFDTQTYAVVDLDEPEQCWRGDNFADWMVEVVKRHEAAVKKAEDAVIAAREAARLASLPTVSG